MQRGTRLLVVAVCAMLAAPAGLSAQGRGQGARGQPGGPPGRGWGPGSAYAQLYDPASVVTVAGEVLDVLYAESPNTPGRGVHLLVETEDGPIGVHLGPEWFVSAQDVQIATGDEIAVTGSEIEFAGKPAIVAAAVVKGDDVLRFRDDDGFPRWSAAGRGRGLAIGRDGWGPESDYIRLYDPAKVETLTGTIESIGYHTPRYCVGWGRELALKTAGETVTVHLGPQWFLERQDMQLAPGEKVTVTGSRVAYEERAVILAAEVLRGEQVLELRDVHGFPRWAAARSARAHGWTRGAQGWGWDSEFTRMYDPTRVIDVQGEVLEVLYVASPGAIGRGVHLRIATASGPITAHLGPEWFLANQDVAIEAGDEVEVVGSLITYEGEEALVASRIERGDDVLDLRDRRGTPRWSAWRRR